MGGCPPRATRGGGVTVVRVPNSRLGEVLTWQVGSRGQERLVVEYKRPLCRIEHELRDVYSCTRQRVHRLHVGDRLAADVVWRVERAFRFSSDRVEFAVVTDGIGGLVSRPIAGSGSYDQRVLAGMVVEHLVDLGVLRLLGKAPGMLRIDWLEFDAWLAAGYLLWAGEP